MAAIAGKNATLWVGGTLAKVLNLDTVKCGITGDTIDTTSLGDTWESVIAGLLKGDPITADGRYDATDTTGQVAIRTAFLAGTAIAFEVRFGTTTPKVAGSAIVSSFGIDADTSGAVKVSIAMQPSGALTFTD